MAKRPTNLDLLRQMVERSNAAVRRNNQTAAKKQEDAKLKKLRKDAEASWAAMSEQERNEKMTASEIAVADETTWSDLPPEWQEKMRIGVQLGAAVIASLTSFAATHDSVKDFKFDMGGVAYIEEYLTKSLQPREEDISALVQMCGFVLGQCIAEMFGGKWMQTKEGWLGVRLSEKHIAFPFAKPGKFLANGNEDNLIDFVRSCSPEGRAEYEIVEAMIESVTTHAGLDPKECHAQWWHKDGKISHVKLKHTSGKVLLIPVSEEAKRRALKGEVPEDVMREELEPRTMQ